MRGKPEQQLAMLSSVSTEDLIPKDHPIRRIRRVVDEVLAELDGEFDAMYSWIGRPSVPPEQLLPMQLRSEPQGDASEAGGRRRPITGAMSAKVR